MFFQIVMNKYDELSKHCLHQTVQEGWQHCKRTAGARIWCNDAQRNQCHGPKDLATCHLVILSVHRLILSNSSMTPLVSLVVFVFLQHLCPKIPKCVAPWFLLINSTGAGTGRNSLSADRHHFDLSFESCREIAALKRFIDATRHLTSCRNGTAEPALASLPL